jgi:hypothetical protein
LWRRRRIMFLIAKLYDVFISEEENRGEGGEEDFFENPIWRRLSELALYGRKRGASKFEINK